MLRMMDYKEVNRRLRLPFGNITAVSPNDRCIWKSLAIDKGAVLTNPFNQASWADNRLLPVEAVPYMYLITFDPNNGEATTTIRVPSGTTPSYPGGTPSKNGYTLSGWSPTIGPATEDKTYTAQWTPNAPTTYTITWLDKDGNQITTSTVAVGGTISVPNDALPYETVNNYDFDGWYTVPGNNKLNPGVTTATGNITYQAKFSPHVEMLAEVYWKLDSNGGGTQHGTAEAISSYENTTWLYNSTPQIHLNQRFEPMYRFNSNDSYYGGTELLDTQYATTNIATVAGVNIKPNDLDWDATIDWSNTTVNTTSGDNRSAYNMNIIFRTVNTDSSAITTITYSDSGVKTDDGSVHKGYGMAVSSTTTDQEMYWKDVIPVTYTAKYNLNGTYVTVFTLTMNFIIYSWNAFNVTSHNETGAPYYGNEPAVGTLVGGSQWASYGNSWLVNT